MFEYLEPLVQNSAMHTEIVIAHPGGSYAGMKMEFPSSVARMAWKTERPLWRPVSTTDRTAAKSQLRIPSIATDDSNQSRRPEPMVQ